MHSDKLVAIPRTPSGGKVSIQFLANWSSGWLLLLCLCVTVSLSVCVCVCVCVSLFDIDVLWLNA